MSAQYGTAQSYTLTANVTAAIATLVSALTKTSGIDISHGEAVSCVVSAPSTQKLVSGTLRCFVYMPTLVANAVGELDPTDVTSMRWFPYVNLDYALVGGTLNRDEAIGDKSVLTGVGRIIWLPDVVTTDGGAQTLTTLHIARRRRG